MKNLLIEMLRKIPKKHIIILGYIFTFVFLGLIITAILKDEITVSTILQIIGVWFFGVEMIPSNTLKIKDKIEKDKIKKEK